MSAEALTRLRNKKGTTEDRRAVVASETAAGRIEAATWWIDVAETAFGGAKIAGPPRLAVAELRRDVAKLRTDAPETRDHLAKHLGRVDALLNRKQFDAARGTNFAAVAQEPLVEDPAMGRTLASLKERVDKSAAGGADPMDLERSRTAFAPTEEAARAAFVAATIDRFAQFRTSGCAPGRMRVSASLEAAGKGGLFAPETARSRIVALCATARRLERTKRLSVFVRSVGSVAYWLDGAPLKATGSDRSNFDCVGGERAEFDLLPQDAVHALFDKSFASGDLPLYFAAMHATLDGAPVPAASWRFNLGGDPADAAPRLGRTPGARKRAKVAADTTGTEPEFDQSLVAHDFIMQTIMGAGRGGDYVAFNDELKDFEKAFSDRGFAPSWLGARCEKFLLTFVTPD